MAFISDGGLSLDQGHLDISFGERKGWVTHEAYGNVETPPIMSLGDPKSGPVVSLSLYPGGPGPGYRTPTHYHGTDQFRMVLKGRAERAISRLKLEARQFAFQEAWNALQGGVQRRGGGVEHAHSRRPPRIGRGRPGGRQF